MRSSNAAHQPLAILDVARTRRCSGRSSWCSLFCASRDACCTASRDLMRVFVEIAWTIHYRIRCAMPSRKCPVEYAANSAITSGIRAASNVSEVLEATTGPDSPRARICRFCMVIGTLQQARNACIQRDWDGDAIRRRPRPSSCTARAAFARTIWATCSPAKDTDVEALDSTYRCVGSCRRRAGRPRRDRAVRPRRRRARTHPRRSVAPSRSAPRILVSVSVSRCARRRARAL